MSEHQPALSEVSLPYERVGRYRLIQRVGEGAFADVYFARDDETLAPVALKVLKPDIDPSIVEQVRVRFLAEEKITRAIDHRFVVHIQGSSAPEERPCFLAMDFVAGRPFCEHLERYRLGKAGAPRPTRSDYLAEVARLGHQVASAMAQAHARGIVHRDLKPQNVLVTRVKPDWLPDVRIVDFGIAKAPVELFSVAAASSVTKYWTELGTVMGSPPYMAPEQRGAAQMATGQADVFALGVMLLGATLTLDLASLEQRSQALKLPDDLETALELRGPLPDSWETLLRAMLRENPGERPTMSEVVLQLQRLARTEAEFAQAVEAWVRHRSVPRARRLLKLTQLAGESPYLTDDERDFLKHAPLHKLKGLQKISRTLSALAATMMLLAAAASYRLVSSETALLNGAPADALLRAGKPPPAMAAASASAETVEQAAQAARQIEQCHQSLASTEEKLELVTTQLASQSEENAQVQDRFSGCQRRQRDLEREVEGQNAKLEEQQLFIERCDRESDRLLVCRQESAVKSRELAETTQRLHTCTKSLRGLSEPPEEVQLGMSSP